MRRLLDAAFDDAALAYDGGPMGDALAAYGRLVGIDDAGLLGRFVCTADRLLELSTAINLPVREVGQLDLLYATPSATAEALAMDLDALDNLVRGGRVIVSEFALRPPMGHELAAAVRTLARKAKGIESRGMLISVELPWGPDQIDAMHACVESIETIGFRALLSGTPSVADVAFFVSEAVNLNAPFGFAATSLVPLTDSKGRLGLLNLLMAGALADAEDLSRREIAELLADTDPAAFRFADDGASWRGCPLNLQEADAFRALFDGFTLRRVEDAWLGLRRQELL